jgi:ATP-dependent helicase/DNAse subunit B
MQRGQLLHAVMHAVWSGPPSGLGSHSDLQQIADLKAFVARHVQSVFSSELPEAARDAMPRRYIELEQDRLTVLITEWLTCELSRVPFEVAETESKRTIALGGLTLDLRLDRLDRLNDGSVLVIDYKTGDVHPSAWDPPRPADVQLPLYGGFALNRDDEPLGGIVFAKIRANESEFQGRVGDAQQTLIPNLSSASALVKTPYTAEMLFAWRDEIERLAADFVAGRAIPDPRDFPNTCKQCGLQPICRVYEREDLLSDDAEDASE